MKIEIDNLLRRDNYSINVKHKEASAGYKTLFSQTDRADGSESGAGDHRTCAQW